MPILFLHNEVYNLKGCHTIHLTVYVKNSMHNYVKQNSLKKKKNTDALFEL